MWVSFPLRETGMQRVKISRGIAIPLLIWVGLRAFFTPQGASHAFKGPGAAIFVTIAAGTSPQADLPQSRASHPQCARKKPGESRFPRFFRRAAPKRPHLDAAGDASLSRLVDSLEGTEHRLQHADIPRNLAVDRRRRVDTRLEFMLCIPREVLEHFNCDAHLRSRVPEPRQ